MKKNTTRIHWTVLLICVLGTVAIGSISGLANAGHIDTWFAGLEKPSFNPPNWLFGPVWTLLYILMGIGLYLVYMAPASPLRMKAIRWFVLQLILNFTWSFLFFYFKSPALAFVEIILLWISILLMVISFHKVSPMAARLQWPYFAWVSFASILNGSIWYLNA